MTDYRLALLDVDGTLRDGEGWKPHSRQLVNDLAESGFTVALCSGRNTESLHGLAAGRSQISFLAAGSGALVQQRSGSDWQTIGERFIATETVQWVHAQAEAIGMELWAYTDRQWLVESVNERVTAESHYVGAEATVGEFTDRRDVVKLLAFPLCKAHRSALEVIDAQRDLAVAQSFPGYFDIVRAEAAAGKGGDVLIERLGLDWSQVVAMGDGENDLGMLSQAGIAMAMAPLRTVLLDPAEDGQQRFDCPDLATAMRHLGELGVLGQ